MVTEPDGRRRIVIEGVSPQVDCGRFAAKAIAGDELQVEADVFADGHDQVGCALLYRSSRQRRWRERAMAPLGNDRWRGSFAIPAPGRYLFTVEGWTDPFATWRRELAARTLAGQDLSLPLAEGAALIEAAAGRAEERARGRDARRLRAWAARLTAPDLDADAAVDPADALDPLDPALADLMALYPDRRFATRFPHALPVEAERERARTGAWYELFPRSTGRSLTGRGTAGRGTAHGTFQDAEKRLEELARMGFDVVYLPPIHPIGRTNRKGRNNAVKARPGDPGSPWAIGSSEGGHTAVHPELGTLEDFRAFCRAAARLGLEVALDIAFQCSPDHPWVAEHPEWFRHRPDGTIQFAENPPKKYEDIYPLDLMTRAWRGLWTELKGVFDFWIDQGITIFRVDNPHTKPFPFWDWVIGEIRREHPDTVLLSEAFTRPKVMYRLAKAGFSQSYTYFAWRNTKDELERYLTELTTPPVADFFRPSFWPNTPDILTEALQVGGRPAFASRLVLAATMASSYGIYGPAFELLERTPREHGSEEYLHSEKYEIRNWDLDREDSLADLITRVNRIRHENPALHRTRNLRFHRVDTEALIAYSKRVPGGPATDGAAPDNTILVVVNLDPDHVQAGWTDLDLEALGIESDDTFQVHDLLSGGRYRWTGARNYVELDPKVTPAHVFRIERAAPPHTERDFPYFL